MPNYIVLAKFTEQGARNIRDMDKLIENNNKIAAAQGIKVTRYFTMGEYDLVALIEAPSDDVALLSLLGIGTAGNLKTVTLKAWPEREFLDILKKLPPAAR